MSKVHDLKLHTRYFSDVLYGIKTWELRRNDRKFCPGDVLRLHEWDPDDEGYTGRQVMASVISMWAPTEHIPIPDDYVLMTICVLEEGT